MAVGVMDPVVTKALSIGIQKLNTCAPTYDTSAGSDCPLNTTQLDGRPWEKDRDAHLRSHALSRSFEYWNGGDLKACRACASGAQHATIKDSKGRNVPTCMTCKPGFFANTGKDGCQPCLPGSFQPDQGKAVCPSCFEGQFQSAGGAVRCNACADGRYAPTRGAVECVDCPPGHSCSDKDREPAPCAKGKYAVGNSTACVECGAGKYQDQVGQSQCEECPATHKCTSGSKHSKFCPSRSPATSLDGVQHSAGLAWCLPNSICKFICADGYAFESGVSDLNECFTNGTWAVDPASKKCVGQPCTENLVLSDPKANTSHCPGTPSGMRCRHRCPAGYVPAPGSRAPVCRLGRWQGMPRTKAALCLQSCGDVVGANMLVPFTLRHANLTVCKDTPSFIPGTDFDGICTFECEPGMEVRKPGLNQIQCVNGKWRQTASTDHCTPSPCRTKDLPSRILDSVDVRHCSLTESGQTCQYKCQKPSTHMPNPANPVLSCAHGKWQLDAANNAEPGCVPACMNAPPATLEIANAKLDMCARIPAVNPKLNFTGICSFECANGMGVLAKSGKAVIRCDLTGTGGAPHWAKIGGTAKSLGTGECTSTLCDISNEDNLVNIQSFGENHWKTMYLPTKVSDDMTEELDWYICRSSTHVFRGTQPFHIGCCQKDVETENGTVIRSGLFPLPHSGRCPRKDDWRDYMDRYDFYNCDTTAASMTPAYIAVAVVVVLGGLSSALVLVIKVVFGSRQVFKKVRRAKNKIKALSKTMYGRSLLKTISKNYTTTESYKRGVEESTAHHKHLVVADSAVASLRTSALKRRLSCRTLSAVVVPLGDEDEVVAVENDRLALAARARSKSEAEMVREEADQLRYKNAVIRIQRQFRAHLARKRYARKGAVAKYTSKISRRVQAGFKGKIKKYKTLVAGGYVKINYSLIIPILLATIDLCSDLLFIRRLSESHYRAGTIYMRAALFVLSSSTGLNFLFFFFIFVHAKKKGKVQDDVWKELMCPWILLIGVTSLTNLNLILLMPWVDRELHAHPTRCSYVTCSLLGYYEAAGQLAVAVAWLVQTQNFNDPITLVSMAFSSIVLITGIYALGLKAVMKAKSEVEKETENAKKNNDLNQKLDNASIDESNRKKSGEVLTSKIQSDEDFSQELEIERVRQLKVLLKRDLKLHGAWSGPRSLTQSMTAMSTSLY